jgi:hypothetical protein
MKQHIKIHTGTSITINRIASLLEEKGIASIIKDNHESGRLAGFGTSINDVELYVLETDVEKATNVLDSVAL